MIRSGVMLVVAALALLPTPAAAQVFPLFDSHIHYSQPDWDVYTPERILSILARAGARRKPSLPAWPSSACAWAPPMAA